MLEYASMRARFFCMMAATLPTVIVMTAMMPSASVQSSWSAAAPIRTTRSAAAKPAFFVPAASSAATGGGDPSYASGSHMWNGTRPILKPNPAMNRPAASRPRGRNSASSAAKPARTSAMFVEPVSPYAIEMPYMMSADARAPNRKYFMAASFELGLRLWKAASTYVGMLISSQATNSMTRSVE